MQYGLRPACAALMSSAPTLKCERSWQYSEGRMEVGSTCNQEAIKRQSRGNQYIIKRQSGLGGEDGGGQHLRVQRAGEGERRREEVREGG